MNVGDDTRVTLRMARTGRFVLLMFELVVVVTIALLGMRTAALDGRKEVCAKSCEMWEDFRVTQDSVCVCVARPRVDKHFKVEREAVVDPPILHDTGWPTEELTEPVPFP